MAGEAVTAPVSRTTPEINAAALAQKVHTELERHRTSRGDGASAPVLLIRADPRWRDGPELTLPDGRQATVVPCVSPLAVWEQVANHASGPADRALVLLTDLDEAEVGDAVIGQVHRHRIFPIEPWDVVTRSFGATRLDPRLRDEKWAGESLLNAMPAAGWPRLPGLVLNRDDALRSLAVVRLGMHDIGVGPDDLDAAALLRWSALPEAEARITTLPLKEKDGLVTWLTEIAGNVADVLFKAVKVGRTSEVLALGLVCDCIWSPDAAALSDRGKGQVGGYLGTNLSDEAARAFGNAAREVVTAMLAPVDERKPRTRVERAAAGVALETAEDLLTKFQLTDAAVHSTLLRSGFELHVEAAGTALAACLPVASPDTVAALADTIVRLRTHRLWRDGGRVERVEMALRLVRWLASTTEPAAPSVADGVRSQVDEWGWVDVAVTHVWKGEDANPKLQAAYRDLLTAVARRQRSLDATFAGRLAAWTSSGTPAKGVVAVEDLLSTVVAPVVRGGDSPVLLVVLDGMSVGVANQLAEELESIDWPEYDPLASKEERRRRGVVAALPTVTEVSRASLFGGRLRRGRAADEVRDFESHKAWGGRRARLFHKRAVGGGAGEVLSGGVAEAMDDRETKVVAVVINTVDDALGPGREGEDPRWRIEQVGQLRTLFDRARTSGRAVIVTSDHGHVLDQACTHRPHAGALSARHRDASAEPGDGEVLLSGPRVGVEGSRVVALWDRGVRYKPYRAGYHGGVSLAEAVIPLLAYVPLGAVVPRGWFAISHRKPQWWDAAVVGQHGELAPAPPSPGPSRRPRRTTTPTDAPSLFDISDSGVAEASKPEPDKSLVEELLASEMFAAQHEMTGRKPTRIKVGKALAALLEAGGKLPVAVVAEHAGEPAARGAGLVTMLERILNVDSFPVLSNPDDGRTVQLDVRLLREQFGLSQEVR